MHSELLGVRGGPRRVQVADGDQAPQLAEHPDVVLPPAAGADDRDSDGSGAFTLHGRTSRHRLCGLRLPSSLSRSATIASIGGPLAPNLSAPFAKMFPSCVHVSVNRRSASRSRGRVAHSGMSSTHMSSKSRTFLLPPRRRQEYLPISPCIRFVFGHHRSSTSSVGLCNCFLDRCPSDRVSSIPLGLPLLFRISSLWLALQILIEERLLRIQATLFAAEHRIPEDSAPELERRSS